MTIESSINYNPTSPPAQLQCCGNLMESFEKVMGPVGKGKWYP